MRLIVSHNVLMTNGNTTSMATKLNPKYVPNAHRYLATAYNAMMKRAQNRNLVIMSN